MTEMCAKVYIGENKKQYEVKLKDIVGFNIEKYKSNLKKAANKVFWIEVEKGKPPKKGQVLGIFGMFFTFPCKENRI